MLCDVQHCLKMEEIRAAEMIITEGSTACENLEDRMGREGGRESG